MTLTAANSATGDVQKWDIVNIADTPDNGRIYVQEIPTLKAARQEVITQAAKHPAAVFVIMENPAPFPGPLSFHDGVLEYVARDHADDQDDPICGVCKDPRCDPYIADPYCGSRD